jgi:hypothetical protein
MPQNGAIYATSLLSLTHAQQSSPSPGKPDRKLSYLLSGNRNLFSSLSSLFTPAIPLHKRLDQTALPRSSITTTLLSHPPTHPYLSHKIRLVLHYLLHIERDYHLLCIVAPTRSIPVTFLVHLRARLRQNRVVSDALLPASLTCAPRNGVPAPRSPQTPARTSASPARSSLPSHHAGHNAPPLPAY